MRFVHFSDIHVWQLGLGLDLYPKRLLGLANLMFRRSKQFPLKVRDRVIQKLADEEADAVLFTGDLTTTSYLFEFEIGLALLTPLLEKYKDRFIAIPGNHDRYTPRVVRDQSFETGFLKNRQQYPFAKRLGENLSVVGIDVSRPHLLTARGRFTDTHAAQLENILQQEEKDNRRIIVLGHYPFVFPNSCHSSWQHRLRGADRLGRVVDRPSVIAYLHGHCHMRWALQLEHVLCLNAGSAGKIGKTESQWPGFVRFTVQDGSLQNIEAIALEPPDFAKWSTSTLSKQPAISC